MNNLLILVGKIYKDLELRSTSNGKSVLDLPLAINNGKDDTTFISVTVFGAMAETVSKYCGKGSLLGVQATVKNHNWEDREGKKHYDYTFMANKITFLGTKQNNEKKQEIQEEINPFEDFSNEMQFDEDLGW